MENENKNNVLLKRCISDAQGFFTIGVVITLIINLIVNYPNALSFTTNNVIFGWFLITCLFVGLIDICGYILGLIIFACIQLYKLYKNHSKV